MRFLQQQREHAVRSAAAPVDNGGSAQSGYTGEDSGVTVETLCQILNSNCLEGDDVIKTFLKGFVVVLSTNVWYQV